jgi:DNA-binding NarL/FixJ family response regulator
MKEPATTAPVSPKGTHYRVLIIDDHPLMRAGIKEFLRAAPELEVCAEVGNAAEAVGILAKVNPDIVVLDLGLPDRNGLEVLKDFQTISPLTPVLVVSMYDEMIYAERTLRAGARGYIMKDAFGDKLLDAVRSIIGGKVWVSERVSSELLGNLGRRHNPGRELLLDRLSDREFEIFRLLGEGHSTRSIAERLRLSPKTVDAHRANIKTKLALKDGAALVRQAVRWHEAQTMRNGNELERT